MRGRSLKIVLVFTVLPCAIAVAANCGAQKSEYRKLNRPLIVTSAADARAYPRLVESATQKLHEYLEGQILKKLNAESFPQPAKLISLIQCIQGGIPQYGRMSEITNFPAAFVLTAANTPTLAIGFVLYRGGAGAPDLQPYLEIVRKSTAGWIRIASYGEEFRGHTLFVYPIPPGKPAQDWFLLSGRRLGGSGASLRIAVAVSDGKTLSEIWTQDMPSGTTIQGVSGNHVILTGETANALGRAEDFRLQYDIVPEGLKLASKTITKSY